MAPVCAGVKGLLPDAGGATTPNPTSGFFLMLKREDTIELNMSVDEALKYIVSMGVVAPPAPPASGSKPVATAQTGAAAEAADH